MVCSRLQGKQHIPHDPCATQECMHTLRRQGSFSSCECTCRGNWEPKSIKRHLSIVKRVLPMDVLITNCAQKLARLTLVTPESSSLDPTKVTHLSWVDKGFQMTILCTQISSVYGKLTQSHARYEFFKISSRILGLKPSHDYLLFLYPF